MFRQPWGSVLRTAIAVAVLNFFPLAAAPARAAAQAAVSATESAAASRAQLLQQELRRADSSRVFIAAHRGDWRQFPENSVRAFESCIAMGIEIAELDVQRTKDGELVIMHDETVDRSTTGHGKVADLTLAEIRALRLRNGLSHRTPFSVPTLREVLQATRGRILLNLDKAYPHFRQIVSLLEETGTLDDALMKGDRPVDDALRENGDLLAKIAYMPVIDLRQPGAARDGHDWLLRGHPVAMEIVFDRWTPEVAELFAACRTHGVRIWVNTLWPEIGGGLGDDLALDDPDAHYGVLLERGVTMFQTDRPAELRAYLARRAAAATQR